MVRESVQSVRLGEEKV